MENLRFPPSLFSLRWSVLGQAKSVGRVAKYRGRDDAAKGLVLGHLGGTSYHTSFISI